jgi:AraC-like DNA-binding protein
MSFVTRTPSAALGPHISKLWYYEGPELGHLRERKLPQTEMQLLVNLHDDQLRWWEGSALEAEHHTRGAAVSGLYSGPVAIDTAQQRRVVGAVVRPGAAPALFSVVAHELAGKHVALDALWGADGALLRERLLYAELPQRILATLDAALTDRLAAHLTSRSPLTALSPCTRISFASHALTSGASVGSVADELGWSAKRLRKQFSAAVGVAPKSFARLARLQRLLNAVASERTRTWAELAVENGYYDQAHLILEFRTLTGLTPSVYRPRTQGDQNHVVLSA